MKFISLMGKISQGFHCIPSLVYLWLAVSIFAASNSITRVIVELGKTHLVDGKNPISLCNVLFVGNICGLGIMLLIFYQEWRPNNLKKISRRDWINLTVISIVSGTLVPSLIFAALDSTNVTNVVLLSRLEPPIALVLSFWLLKSPLNLLTTLGSLISFAGVAVTILLSLPEMSTLEGNFFHIGQGEIFTVIGATLSAISTVYSKSRLSRIPLGIFSVFRNALGTVVFFIFANLIYGPTHFGQVFSPFLWQWMLLYSLIIVVIGQLSWLAGLRDSTATEVNLANSCNPIIAIFIAYLILKEVPTREQFMGGAIILMGIALSFLGNQEQKKKMAELIQENPANSISMATGFKGL